MDFSGPEPTDFANVRALNRAFILKLRSPAAGNLLRERIPAALRVAVEGLTDGQVDRLSASPFLLLSLREHDAGFWDQVETDPPVGDLFAAQGRSPDEIAVAAISFVWQLSRRNPYAARLVTGASPWWCERLAEFTLLSLLQRVSCCHDFLRPRFAGDADCWRKLLGTGLSSEPRIRESAYLACLQTLMTRRLHGRARRMRAAACSSSVPVLSLTGPNRSG